MSDPADPFDRDVESRAAIALALELGCPQGYPAVDWLRLQIANRDRALELIAALAGSEATVEQDRQAAINMARAALLKGPTL